MKDRYREARIIRAHEKRAERHPLWEIYGWRLGRVFPWIAAAVVAVIAGWAGYRWAAGHVHFPALSLSPQVPSEQWLWLIPGVFAAWLAWRVVKWFGGY